MAKRIRHAGCLIAFMAVMLVSQASTAHAYHKDSVTIYFFSRGVAHLLVTGPDGHTNGLPNGKSTTPLMGNPNATYSEGFVEDGSDPPALYEVHFHCVPDKGTYKIHVTGNGSFDLSVEEVNSDASIQEYKRFKGSVSPTSPKDFEFTYVDRPAPSSIFIPGVGQVTVHEIK